jgi:hypothetical protein
MGSREASWAARLHGYSPTLPAFTIRLAALASAAIRLTLPFAGLPVPLPTFFYELPLVGFVDVCCTLIDSNICLHTTSLGTGVLALQMAGIEITGVGIIRHCLVAHTIYG